MKQQMKKLSRGEYHATFTTQMTPLGPAEPPPFEFWSYFDAIPTDDFEGHDFSGGQVTEVYRTAGGRYLHALIAGKSEGWFLVLVLNCKDRVVYGHYLLELPASKG